MFNARNQTGHPPDRYVLPADASTAKALSLRTHALLVRDTGLIAACLLPPHHRPQQPLPNTRVTWQSTSQTWQDAYCAGLC
jgi:hypothetical protein